MKDLDMPFLVKAAKSHNTPDEIIAVLRWFLAILPSS